IDSFGARSQDPPPPRYRAVTPSAVACRKPALPSHHLLTCTAGDNLALPRTHPTHEQEPVR
ncbi:hypothetical protein ACWC4A_52150, partial [Streptomyces mirabilis]